MFTIVLYLVLASILLVMGIMNICGKLIPDNAKRKLDEKSLFTWAKFRGIGCLLASPVFFIISYSQYNPVLPIFAYISAVFMLCACLLVFGANKKYFSDFLGR